MKKCKPDCPGFLRLIDQNTGKYHDIPCPKCATKNAKVKG